MHAVSQSFSGLDCVGLQFPNRARDKVKFIFDQNVSVEM